MIKLIELPKIIDPRGNLTFLQNYDQIPFKIERVFWTFNVPGGERRGGHAFKKQHELIIALSGSFDVVFTDPFTMTEIKYSLNRSYNGIYIPPKNWRHIENFSTNAVALHLSSSIYQDCDYVRNFDEFINLNIEKI